MIYLQYNLALISNVDGRDMTNLTNGWLFFSFFCDILLACCITTLDLFFAPTVVHTQYLYKKG